MKEDITYLVNYLRELSDAGYSKEEIEAKLRVLIFDELSEQLGVEKILLCGPMEKSFEEYCEKIGISEKEIYEKILGEQNL